MKKILYLLLSVSLINCKKEYSSTGSNEPITPVVPITYCAVKSVQEYPQLNGDNVTATFTLDNNRRISKVEKIINGMTISKSVFYVNDRIDSVAYATGGHEKFHYLGDKLSEWEVTGTAGQKRRYTYAYNASGKLMRKDVYQLNSVSNHYDLRGYSLYKWDSEGNISKLEQYNADNELMKTTSFTYHTDKLNKQRQLAPQFEVLFLDWSEAMIALLNSKNLIKSSTGLSENIAYELNELGYIKSVKSGAEVYVMASYSCN